MAFTAEQQRDRRAWRAAQGLCVTCGRSNAPAGRRTCRACQQRSVDRKRERVERWRAAGLCIRCGGKDGILPGSAACETCLEDQRARNAQRPSRAKSVILSGDETKDYPARPVKRRKPRKGHTPGPPPAAAQGGAERAERPVYDGRGRLLGYSVWHGGPGISTANGSSLKMNERR